MGALHHRSPYHEAHKVYSEVMMLQLQTQIDPLHEQTLQVELEALVTTNTVA